MWILLLLISISIGQIFTVGDEVLDDVTPRIGHSQGVVLVSTLDGQLQALNMEDGSTKWTLQEDPVLRAPTTVKKGFTFLPNPQDGSLYVLKEGILKRLPLNIPALVHASPLKSSDGVLYAGSKRDVWLEIDPLTGAKVETMSATNDKVCPANNKNAVFVGRTEYRISMYDTKNREKTWNTTFSDYTAHLLPSNNDYPFRHYVTSNGNVLTVGPGGEIIWERDFGLPVVAMYLLQNDGLHKLNYVVMGGETMENIIKSALTPGGKNDVLADLGVTPQTTSPQHALFATLYVGESPFGLYAMDVLVDKHTITYAPKYLGPPLLEGPSPIALSAKEKAQFVPSSRPVISIDIPAITHKTTDGVFLLLGYHEKPQVDLSAILPIRFSNTPSFPPIVYKPDVKDMKQITDHSTQTFESSLSGMLLEIYLRHPTAFATAVFTLLALAITVVWLCGKQSGVALIAGEVRSAQTSRQSNSGLSWVSGNEEVPEGWMKIGKLQYNPTEILGRGCEGTVVYRGKFDGRDVAVKRVVSEFVRLVDREADLLRESDTHPNVIRYFCMESDSQFRYLALELCVASLNDYVTEETIREKVPISSTELLRQATEGLAHLHIMQIVHRDMKPQNVLLSTAGARGVRAVISDFGLCKRVQPGRQSLSKRSGLAGTDGWIAPEALICESTSFPVDVFSLGCIFYYVLSDGEHPFGDSLHRQTNIINGEYTLLGIKQDVPVAVALIESMIQRIPKSRPSLQCVLAHPFFWEPERRLQFFGDVSDRIEKEEDTSMVARRLEHNARAVVGGNWRNNICAPLAADLRKFRTYKGHSVRDLLRAMRNKKHHYRELPEDVRESLGLIPEQFVSYFTSRFPLLLLHTYEAMKWCADEGVFRSYYPDEDIFCTQVRLRMKEEIENDELQRKLDSQNMETEWVRGQAVKHKPPAKTIA
ncbi:unnamed protein product [Cylicocyclus nassatus]|uniref:non-specific serine/threonine protein kinase n=1 Tax=Cylicocyclus nassatus TaxID=53992 RepID=A0AA36H8S7_CYLNA|nr:unnamed protein product [Cylicocyclus nassatus]